MEAGLRAVQPAIEKDLEPYEKVMIPIYKDIAKGLGLQFDGDEDDLASKGSEDEQLEGENCEKFADGLSGTNMITESDSTAKRDSHTAPLAEEQPNAGSTEDLIDLDLDLDSPRECQSRLPIKRQMRRLIKRSKIIGTRSKDTVYHHRLVGW